MALTLPTSRRFGVAFVVAVALGIVGYRDIAASAASRESASKIDLGGASTTVVLFADLGQDKEDICGCGRVIRAARAARARGVHMQEFDTTDAAELAFRYRALVSPTLLVLDENGAEKDRYEGGQDETFARMSTVLQAIPDGRR